MKVDFVHVGYHKTASTWLQVYGLKAHGGVKILNDAASGWDRVFVENFIELGDLEFAPERFAALLEERLRAAGPAKVVGVSEENLTGHYWHGAGERLLAERVKEIFGPVKIVIFVREQRDMLRSLYGNYVKYGGVKSLPARLADYESWGSRVYAKLCYHRLIALYDRLFTPERVLILFYEDLRDRPQETMDRFFSFIGAEPLALPKKVFSQRINPGLSPASEPAMRWLNFLGENRLLKKILRGTDRYLIRRFSQPDMGKVVAALDGSAMKRWAESNRLLQARTGADLAALGYLL